MRRGGRWVPVRPRPADPQGVAKDAEFRGGLHGARAPAKASVYGEGCTGRPQ